MEPQIKFDVEAGIATLTLCRPEARNALSDAMVHKVTEYLNHVQNDPDIIALILRGAGPHFCAGIDLKWAHQAIHASNEENNKVTHAFANMLHKFYYLNKPTITIAQGAVYGGGIGFIACSDIALSLPDTTFCFAEVKLGLVPAIISPYVLSILGQHITKRYMLTAEAFNAKKACEIGLIDEMVTNAELSTRIGALTELLKNNGRNAMKIAKKLIYELTEDQKTVETNLSHTANLLASLCTSKEAEEGLTAFLEKRKPHWFSTP